MAKGYKTGGRQKGTPNKNNPIKKYLLEHSIRYFTPRNQLHPESGELIEASDFDIDMMEVTPEQRVNAEIKLLKYHTPEIKSIDIDMTVGASDRSIEDRIAALLHPDPDSTEDDD